MRKKSKVSIMKLDQKSKEARTSGIARAHEQKSKEHGGAVDKLDRKSKVKSCHDQPLISLVALTHKHGGAVAMINPSPLSSFDLLTFGLVS